MSATNANPIDLAPNRIADAYYDFKGSTKRAPIPEAQEVLDSTHTARTSQWRKPRTDESRLGELVACVTVYLADSPSEVPAVIETIAERHDLVEAERDAAVDGEGIKSVTYIQDEDAADLKP